MQRPDLDPAIILQIGVGALNNTAGPEGLVPTLLVFGMAPKLPLAHIEHLIPSQRQRFAAMELARREMEAIVAELRVKVAATTKTPHFEAFKPGDLALVRRENNRIMQGPHTVESQQRATVIVRNTEGNKFDFPVAVVRKCTPNAVLFNSASSSHHACNPTSSTKSSPFETFFTSIANHFYDERHPCCRQHPVAAVKNRKDPRFIDPKNKEWQGLFDNDAFEFAPIASLPADANILHGRFALAIKDPETEHEEFKARYVVQGHRGKGKEKLVVEAPTALRTSIRIVVANAAMNQWPLWTRDARQACMQSDKELQRDVCMRPPKGFVIEPGYVLRLKRARYGAKEPGTRWWLTFERFYTIDLSME